MIRWPRFLTPTQLSQIIRDQKNPLTALQIFNEATSRFPNYRHNGPVYSTIINTLANSGLLPQMKDVIHQMKQDSCECKDSIFTTAIKTYAKAGMLDEAVSLFKNLPQFNCVNWTESFLTLLQILVKQSKFDESTAHRLFIENSNAWEVKTRIRSLNVLIGALCRRNRSDLALQIFQEMNDQCCYPNKETYRVLMRGLCEDGRLNEATHLLYSMFWRISQKGSGEDVVVYRTLLEALCDNGHVEEAVEILRKVLRKGLKAPKRCLQGLDLENGSLEEIKCSINQALIRGGVPSLASYSAMAVDFYSEGNIDDANKVFEEMRERGFRPLVSTYEAKIRALCREGRADVAARVIEEEMVEGNCVPTVGTYNILLKGLCHERKSMRAVGYLDKMARQVGCVADKETYSVLVDGLCWEGRFVEASKVFERMLDRKYWPCGDTVFNKLIRGLCSVGRIYEAFVLLEEMVSQGKVPDGSVWNSLVAAVCTDEVDDFVGTTLEQLTNSCMNLEKELT
ncbi:Pentatricopeptide repeat [Macleaya cordata]|uniref:Pentatricopeptide repeat n=1 Tax=Macleaya cordata TaxID=56857 RepID=A0A200QVZ2_MACCD|nr:Pentatricopeptide repeat [Macleaya cordata]